MVDQNGNTPGDGQISQYQLNKGSFAGTWVPKTDPNAPFAPRGAALKNGVLYVANFVKDEAGLTPGEVLAFAGNGKFLGELIPSSPDLRSKFRPRGIVVGPDGLLYVSSDPCFAVGTGPGTGPTTGGQVLRFDPNTLGTLGFKGVFIDESPSALGLSCASSSGWAGHLNRPEGLVFGPDGNLYITSFCPLSPPVSGTPPKCVPMSTDSIRIYDASGKFLSEIQLDQPGSTQSARASAQALLFGPSGNLFVPTSAGQVLKCVQKSCKGFVQPGTLGFPFYLTFGRTDSGTLSYPNE